MNKLTISFFIKNLKLTVSLLIFGSIFSATFAQSPGLEPGNKAPEISLPDISGKTILLTSLKDKLVLIDFWATCCSLCVEEQSELARLYKKFKTFDFSNGKGFEIYGVSLDIKKTNWENFVKTKKINWIQVSDLKFWKSPVAKTYNIQELPYNVLIDGNGIILAKNLHGIELEQAIAGNLKK
jgi:peroxiredoxin